jgi:hypothetical protein
MLLATMGVFLFSFFIEVVMTFFKFNQLTTMGFDVLNILKLHNVIGDNGFLK